MNGRDRRHNWAGVQMALIAVLLLMSIYEVSQGDWRWIGNNILAIGFLALLVVCALLARSGGRDT
jgi:hypothetical protein